MVTVRFQVVSRAKTIRFKCPCGKRFQRTIRVEQTINPWNKNAAGIPKSYSEIWKELGEELADLPPDATHSCGQVGVPIAPRESS